MSRPWWIVPFIVVLGFFLSIFIVFLVEGSRRPCIGCVYSYENENPFTADTSRIKVLDIKVDRHNKVWVSYQYFRGDTLLSDTCYAKWVELKSVYDYKE